MRMLGTIAAVSMLAAVCGPAGAEDKPVYGAGRTADGGEH